MHEVRPRRGLIRLAAVTAAVLAPVAGIAAPASAATDAATTNAAIVAPQFSCGWTPANDSGAPGTFTADGVNIHDGNDTGCTVEGEGYTGQTLDIRCFWNGNGYEWFYVTDETTGVTGWAVRNYIAITASPVDILSC